NLATLDEDLRIGSRRVAFAINQSPGPDGGFLRRQGLSLCQNAHRHAAAQHNDRRCKPHSVEHVHDSPRRKTRGAKGITGRLAKKRKSQALSPTPGSSYCWRASLSPEGGRRATALVCSG